MIRHSCVTFSTHSDAALTTFKPWRPLNHQT
jgi:hypothetical protein